MNRGRTISDVLSLKRERVSVVAVLMICFCAGVILNPVRLEAASNDLPSPEALLRRHIEAIGGAKALTNAQSLDFEGEVSLPFVKAQAPIEFLFQAPDRFYYQLKYHHAFFGFVKVPFVAKREAEAGFDGTNGWIIDFDGGIESLSGMDETFFRGLLDKFSPLCFRRNFFTARTLDVEGFGDRDCYRVLVVFPSGDRAFEFYDVQNGLLAGTMYPFDTGEMVANVQTTYSDFRQAGNGLKLPFRIEFQVGGEKYAIRASKIRTDDLNVKVPASKSKTAAVAAPILKPSNVPAREVIEKYVATCGGAEALRKHTSLRLSGRYERPGTDGYTNWIEVVSAMTNRFSLKLPIPEGYYREGFDGTRFWTVEGKNVHFATGSDLAQKSAEKQFLGDLHGLENFRSVETLGTIEVDGQECYQVLLIRNNGEMIDEFYEVKSGLLRERRTSDERGGGALQLVAKFDDYRRFDGWMVPRQQHYKVIGEPQGLIVTNAQWDVVSDSAFEMPAEVRAKLEEKK